MKLLSFLLIICAQQSFAQQSIYDLDLQTIDSNRIMLNTYTGKKMLIAAISPDNLEKSGLVFLDSIQTRYPSLQVIIIPSLDYGGDRNKEIMISISKNKLKKTLVAGADSVSKSSSARQNAVMHWLTHVEENTHFGQDSNTDFQLYLVNESGVLYAALDKGVRLKVLDDVLNQPDFKP